MADRIYFSHLEVREMIRLLVEPVNLVRRKKMAKKLEERIAHGFRTITCEVCGKVFDQERLGRPKTTCSDKCRQRKFRRGIREERIMPVKWTEDEEKRLIQAVKDNTRDEEDGKAAGTVNWGRVSNALDRSVLAVKTKYSHLKRLGKVK